MLTPEQVAALRATPTSEKRPNRVRVAMELAGKSREELAAELGLSYAHVSSVMNGQVPNLPLPTARKFATYFSCEVDDIFPPHGVAA